MIQMMVGNKNKKVGVTSMEGLIREVLKKGGDQDIEVGLQ